MNVLLHHLGIEFLKEWVPFIGTIAHLLVIAGIAWGLLVLSRRLIRLFEKTIAGHHVDEEDQRRVETISRLINNLSSTFVWLVAGMLMLSEIGISVQPLLATAGVAGLAIGFGAQSLIKDYFAGFFLLIEDQLRHDDLIEIAGKSGMVERITLRHVRLRDYEGNVHYVPNGIITTVTNRSRGHAFAVLELSVAYQANLDRAFELMHVTAAELRSDPELSPLILADLEMSGVDQLAESSVVIRSRLRVRAGQQQRVRREYLRRIKLAFDANGIEIPFRQLTIHSVKADAAKSDSHD